MAHQQYSTAGEGFPLLTDAVSNASVPLFVENLLRGEKPRAEWMCGVEFELFGYDRARSFERIDAEQVERVLAGFAPSSNDLVHEGGDRKSTRLNSSHDQISYAVFCLKKKMKGHEISGFFLR